MNSVRLDIINMEKGGPKLNLRRRQERYAESLFSKRKDMTRSKRTDFAQWQRSAGIMNNKYVDTCSKMDHVSIKVSGLSSIKCSSFLQA